MNANDAVIGAAIERIEDTRLLTGNGRYIDDMHRTGMLHAVVVRSPAAHGLIKTIETAEARSMLGVRAIYTGRDIADESNGRIPAIPLRLAPVPQLVPFEQPVIALDKVRYVGECLALVIAETQAQAEDAASRVEVDIEMLPALADYRTAARDESFVFPAYGTNAAITYVARKGDAQKTAGPYVRRETFGVQRHSAITMETRGLVAEWDEIRGKLCVFGAAKVPFSTRATLAPMMD